MRPGAYTSVSVLPKVDTSVSVRVSDGVAPHVSIVIGDGGQGVTVIATEEETLNTLLAAVGEARAKLVGAIGRAKRQDEAQRELLAAS